eukprot:TRINITY_DN9055_c0_g1_i1.p1 TRINITY_DN9055_c0_g1~~TRINITY_DN9055_c0_g1_i1.p1  ORF type:complete len:140 (+),score=14.25 TRINITY_DN9055_c0_g1_i1:147-566(+)
MIDEPSSFDEKLKNCSTITIFWYYWMPMIHLFSIFWIFIGDNKAIAFLVFIQGILGWYGECKLFDMIGFSKIIGLSHLAAWLPGTLFVIQSIIYEDIKVRGIFGKWLTLVLATQCLSMVFDLKNLIFYFLYRNFNDQLK